MMNHRVTVIFECIRMDNFKEISHDEKMALIWRLVEETDKNIHKNEEKPYTWSINNQGDKYVLLFSCIDDEIMERFTNHVNELKNAGISVGTNIWKVTEVIPIEDYPFFNPTMRLMSLNGAYFYQPTEGTHKVTGKPIVYKRRVNVSKEPEEVAKQISFRLIRRANKYLGTNFTDEDVKIRYVELIPGSGHIEYKGRTLGIQTITFKIKAPKEIMETALYGGIGALTGSGFGAVVIA